MPPEKKVSVYGQEIHYYEEGKGPAVIFLHGMVGTSTDWAYNLGPLSQNYHVIALDQVGFGHSSKPRIEYTIANFVDFLREFMRVRRIPKAVIVANSLGGWIACDFAASHPDLVDRLVLVDASGLDAPVHHDVPVDMNPSTQDGMRRLWETLFFDQTKLTPEIADYSWNRRLRDGDSDTIRRLVAGLVKGNEFEDAKMGSIKARTLIIWGHDDKILPLEAGQRLQRALPGSELVVIDECGHVPQLEKPAEFNRILLRFLSRP
ncbi:MAG TPA: alpha/beta hydrolase [Terriglobia bacterium]|nr:alpha/beta hydrolase [Terriglobia bacterium]